ncbi:MAG: RHS repeat-associated core domain-containing protein [Anaerolineae bacterium]|nr:RHS repeat-associated core domain-containing protein [Anaerolineae bacterium]
MSPHAAITVPARSGSPTIPVAWSGDDGAGSGTGTLPTDFGFTGQRNEGTIGLYDYRARYYDPALGRFVSADTVVPNPGDPQDLNRYAYVRNNPLRYTDPSGYCIPGVNCPDDPPKPAWSPPSGYRPQSTEEYIAYLGWVQAQIELERRETGGTVVTLLMQQSLNLELSTLMKYINPEKAEELAWQGAMMGAPFAAAAVGSLAGDAAEDAVLAAQQAIGDRIGGTELVGTKVYRVWGEEPLNPDVPGAKPWGRSWTPVDPSTVPDFREAAGLPSGGETGAYNTGRFVSVGIITDASGIQVRQALSVDNKPDGLPEFVVPNPQTQITLIGVYGVNPPY